MFLLFIIPNLPPTPKKIYISGQLMLEWKCNTWWKHKGLCMFKYSE